jgi:hypothetical protein
VTVGAPLTAGVATQINVATGMAIVGAFSAAGNASPSNTAVGAAAVGASSAAAAAVSINPAVGGFSRASTATYFDDTETLQIADVNMPRFGYDMNTGAFLGLIIEDQSTNFVRNPTALGTVPGTPGIKPTDWGSFSSAGITINYVNIGVQNGIPYVDIQLVGSCPNNFIVYAFETGTIPATIGQIATESFYCALVDGDLTNITAVSLNLRWNPSPASSQIFTPTSTFTRYSVTSTATNASTTNVFPAFLVNVIPNAPIDITLRFGGPQIEFSDAASTLILPPSGTIASSTRAADVQSQIISAIGAAGVATQTNSASAATTIGSVSATGIASATNSGAGAATLAAFTTSAIVAQINPATGASAIGPFSASASANLNNAVGAAALRAFTARGVAFQFIPSRSRTVAAPPSNRFILATPVDRFAAARKSNRETGPS